MPDFTADIAALNAEIDAINDELGIDPQNGHSNVKVRLDAMESRIDTSPSPAFSAGGDLSGTNVLQTVVGIQGIPVSNITPQDGYALAFDLGTGKWTPSPVASDSSVVTSNKIIWTPATAGLAKYAAVTGKAVSTDANPEDIVFDWTNVPAFPADSIIKTTAELTAIDSGLATKWATLDLGRDFRLNSGAGVAAALTNEDHVTRADAAGWSANISFDNGTLRPKVTVTGTIGRTLDWSAILNVTYAEKVTPYVPPAFNYASIAWTLDFEGDNRTNHALIGTASAGTSGSHQMVSPSADNILAGGTFNGHGSIDWNSDTIWSSGEFVLSNVISSTAFTIIYVVDALNIVTMGSAYYNAPRLFGDGSGAYFGTAIADIGAGNQFICGVYSGSFKQAAVNITTGKQILTCRLNGSTISVRKNKEAWVDTTGVGGIALLTGYMRNNDPISADCNVARASFTDIALNDPDVDEAIDFLAVRYGITV